MTELEKETDKLFRDGFTQDYVDGFWDGAHWQAERDAELLEDETDLDLSFDWMAKRIRASVSEEK